MSEVYVKGTQLLACNNYTTLPVVLAAVPRPPLVLTNLLANCSESLTQTTCSLVFIVELHKVLILVT